MQESSWSWLIIGIHWITAIAVIALFAVGLWMVDLNYYSDWYKTAPHYHKSVGLLLALLTLIRMLVRWLKSRPQPLGAAWEQRVSSLAHAMIYLLLLGLFISGYLISTADGRSIDVFNWFTIPGAGSLIERQEDLAGEVHFYLAWTLIILAGLHALAAFKHHFWDRDATLKRMLKP
ncbi:Cytochrome b561 like protein [Saliniradius amylolyticus]|uniref:Cytochrome b561 like protein n=1 Tax=Saliniradius amylolyticus TaxID=2183582 RepID=A0A2S2E179_9ALTE|nr:cytochrome b [Saliniradius amylolyticus]AWL11376.1 Cytochrome b561 like protein [Saliniradius amylolyticus]